MSNLPSDFTDRMKKLLGEQWEEFEECYQNDRYQALRFNTLKKGVTAENTEELLKKIGIEETVPVKWAENGYYYGETVRPGKHPYHEAGLYYIQEPSAMSAASLLAPEPGERVLDLCAAPGGKSTQLAAYMKQQGVLVANEINAARCKILSQNIERLGIANAIVTNEDSGALAERFEEYFDRILVDAPCSGEGMFRKNPEAVDEWSMSQVRACAERQLMILDNAAGMLACGGVLVYSTCTFAPDENEGVIGAFLEKHGEFELMTVCAPYFDAGIPEWGNGDKTLSRTFRLWPHHLHGEGHFAAVLRKRDDAGIQYEMQDAGQSEYLRGNKRKRSAGEKGEKVWSDRKQRELLDEFVSETLSEKLGDYIMSGKLTLFGEQLYRLPEDTPPLAGIHVLRAGLHIGTFKKNRFEPSHSLALFLGADDVKGHISFAADDERTAMYYRGESIVTDEAETDNMCRKGWCLVCVDGYSAGWGKMTDGQLKNHYPKGLRR